MTKAQQDYQHLFELSHHISTLHSILSLLNWDQETYMPHKGVHFRSEQNQLLSGMIHREKTSKTFSKALAKLIDLDTGEIVADGLKPRQKAALREWRRDWKQNNSLPEEFVKKFSKLTSEALHAWSQAKTNNDFESFAPYLERLVEMNRKKADYLGWEEHPYDALIDLHEHDITTKEIEKLFKQVRGSIHELLEKIGSAKQVKNDFLHGRFLAPKQLEFGRMTLKDMGYDFEMGRIDLSAHPFSTSITPDDNRITTRIHPTCVASNILTLLHEGGHSLYSMGLPKDQFGSPLGEAISMGMHECQSRFWETRIGQSRAYWKHYLPLLRETFKGKFDSIKLDTFYNGINRVSPSFIRVNADEVTYPLHVILRFEMEKALIEGSLAVREVPAAWNSKMEELLGITPSNDREGCLQDIHWAMGAFGYFPSYALGSIYASHLFEAFEDGHPDWEERVGRGDLLFIKEWLDSSVYKWGRQFSSLELLKKATGKKLSSEAFVQYLTNKYSDIYKL